MTFAQEIPPAAQTATDQGIAAASRESWAEAIAAFQEARRVGGDRPPILFNLGMAYARAGQDLLGAAWLRAYLATGAAGERAPSVEREIERLLAAAQAKVRHITAGVASVASGLAQTTESDVYGKVRALAALAKAQAKTLDLDGALQTLRSAEALRAALPSGYQPYDDPRALEASLRVSFAVAMARSGSPEEALNAMVGVDSWNQDDAFNEIFNAFLRQGKLAAARRTIDKIKHDKKSNKDALKYHERRPPEDASERQAREFDEWKGFAETIAQWPEVTDLAGVLRRAQTSNMPFGSDRPHDAADLIITTLDKAEWLYEQLTLFRGRAREFAAMPIVPERSVPVPPAGTSPQAPAAWSATRRPTPESTGWPTDSRLYGTVLPSVGIAIKYLKPETAAIERFGVPIGNFALVVTYVHPGGAGETAGLQPGDVITNVDGVSPRSVKDFEAAIARATPKGIAALAGLKSWLTREPSTPPGNTLLDVVLKLR